MEEGTRGARSHVCSLPVYATESTQLLDVKASPLCTLATAIYLERTWNTTLPLQSSPSADSISNRVTMHGTSDSSAKPRSRSAYMVEVVEVVMRTAELQQRR